MNKNLRKKMSEERAINIIKKPLMTEKSTNLNQFNQYSFRVDIKSNSIEIKNAVEKSNEKILNFFNKPYSQCSFFVNKIRFIQHVALILHYSL